MMSRRPPPSPPPPKTNTQVMRLNDNALDSLPTPDWAVPIEPPPELLADDKTNDQAYCERV